MPWRSRGWSVVAACGLIAACSWGLGFYGLGVYLEALHRLHGWPTSLISGAITVYYLVGAVALLVVGGAIERRGPTAVMVYGSVVMGAAVAALGWLREPWELFAVLAVMGTAWACLSLTAITSAILPWFPDRSAPAVTLALTGASVGGMLFVPGLVAIGQARGFVAVTAAGGAALLLVALPLAAFGVRGPGPAAGAPDRSASREAVAAGPAWSRRAALRTLRFWTLSLSFGLALVAQVGFIVHQLAFLEPALGPIQAALAVSATTVSALLGRVAAAALADRVDRRVLSAAIFTVQAAALATMAAAPSPVVLFTGSVAFGLGVGNVITLPPLIAHAEFGARSFATIFGMTSAAIQLGVAAGPGLVGLLRDLTGGYAPAIGVLAGLDALAGVGVLWGRGDGRVFDSPRPSR
ncbi:MAG TPA: MFS transporter [Methylomirabilota bacterium]